MSPSGDTAVFCIPDTDSSPSSPSSAMGLVILVLTALMPAALAAPCLTPTFPDILGLKACLGTTSLVLCTGQPADVIVTSFAKAFQCLFKGLTQFNSLGAVAVILEVIKIVFNQNNLPLPNLSPFCVANPATNCVVLFPPTTTATCGATSIPVSVPNNAQTAQCFTFGSLVCTAPNKVTDALVNTLMKTISCLLKAFIDTNPRVLEKILGCIIYNLLAGIAASIPLPLNVPVQALAGAVKVKFRCP
ncbi:uncharacterized protein LOC144101692 isoform X1 [Amblyomma americanum]